MAERPTDDWSWWRERRLPAPGLYLDTAAAGRSSRATLAAAASYAKREALLAAAHEQSHQARLAALGCHDDAGLCQAIRDGSLDHRFEEVAAAVRAATVDKLTVANPAHLARPG